MAKEARSPFGEQQASCYDGHFNQNVVMKLVLIEMVPEKLGALDRISQFYSQSIAVSFQPHTSARRV